MIRRRLATTVAIAVVALGLATSAFWLQGAFPLRPPVRLAVIAGLTTVALLTTLNLTIRWMRWHFLLRRWKIVIKTRESLAMWLVALPGIATPFYVGELSRSAFFRGRIPKPVGAILGIWFIERLADVYVLGFSVFAVRGEWPVLGAIAAVTIMSAWVLRQVPHAEVVRTLTQPAAVAVILASTGAAWALPVVGMSLLLSALQAPLPPTDAIEAFGVGTLLGGFSGIPLGIGIAGSAMIVSLQASGIESETAALAVAVFRAGTVWYAVGLGLVAVALARRFFLPLLWPKPAARHFDQIAETYSENIPPHIVGRMLRRKIEAMQPWLARSADGRARRGLDVGCGQGWYVAAMAEHGHRMIGVDLSLRQLQQARQNLADGGAPPLSVSDIAALPFAEESFDFAFGVNVIHHVPRGHDRKEVFTEILRTLKPDGVFFLQEINIRNPLFRFYMGYIFPLLRDIDEGTEEWLTPERLPEVDGARWRPEVAYFNFLPDFTPAPILRRLAGLEARLEQSRLRVWSSHYVACLAKGTAPQAAPAESLP